MSTTLATGLRYLRGGHLWNVVAAALNQGSTFVSNILLANILLPEEFGRYGAIQVSVTVIASAAQLSAWLSAAHFAGRYRDTAREKLGKVFCVIRGVVVVTTGCAALLLIALRDQYGATFLHDSRAGIEVAVAAFYILFTGLNSYQIGVLVGLDALKGYAKSAIIQGLASVVLVVGMGYAGGVLWALCGLSISAGVRWALTASLTATALAHVEIKLQRKGASEVLAEVMRFALPASVNGFTSMAALWITAALIVSQPEGLFLSALYVACLNIKTLVLFVPLQANNASIAYLSRYRANASAEYKTALSWNLFMISLATLSGALVVVFFASHFLSLFGDPFVVGTEFLQVLMAASFVEALAYGLTQHFTSSGTMWTAFCSASVPRDLTLVLGVSALLSSHGLAGVALSFLASWIVYIAGLTIVVIYRRRKVARSHETSRDS